MNRSHAVVTAPLVHRLVPIESRLVATIVRVVVGVAFLALLAQVRVEIGPVPLTGQTLGVLLIAAAYGSTLGIATLAAYLGVGAAGIGVFSGGAAGLAVLQGATGGYLVGFVLAGAIVGAMHDRGVGRSVWWTTVSMVIGNLVIYACGVTWLSQFAPDLSTALAWGVWPFLVGDVLKIAVAAAVLPLAWRLVGRR